MTLLGSMGIMLPLLAFAWPDLAVPSLQAGTNGLVHFAVPTAQRVVALSIDDGPSSATDELLDVLAANDAHATFFVIGEHVTEAPAATRRIVRAGHELGHHMMADEPSIRLSADQFRAEFARMDTILAGYGGATLFRPGSGWFNDRMVDEASQRGYRLVLGSVYSFDAQLPFADFHAWFVLRSVRPGSIIVLHEGERRGARTARVLREVLPELRRRGYRIVTVSELLASTTQE